MIRWALAVLLALSACKTNGSDPDARLTDNDAKDATNSEDEQNLTDTKGDQQDEHNTAGQELVTHDIKDLLDLDAEEPPSDLDSGDSPEADVGDLDAEENSLHDGDLWDTDLEANEDTDVGCGAMDCAAQDVVTVYPDIPCCFPMDTPGCGNEPVRDCVCALDPYCCSPAWKWDENCVKEVEFYKCGSCAEGIVCGDGTCDPSEHCETCPSDCGVCPSYCGDTKCELPETCGTCPKDCGVCEGSTCCKPQTTPNCDQQVVQECVCFKDSYCCNVAWDENCISEIASFECGFCPT